MNKLGKQHRNKRISDKFVLAWRSKSLLKLRYLLKFVLVFSRIYKKMSLVAWLSLHLTLSIVLLKHRAIGGLHVGHVGSLKL